MSWWEGDVPIGECVTVSTRGKESIGGMGMATCRVNSTFAGAARARGGSVRIEGMQRQGWQGDGRVEQGVEYGEQVALHCHALGQMVQVGEGAVVMARMQCLVGMPCSSK